MKIGRSPNTLNNVGRRRNPNLDTELEQRCQQQTESTATTPVQSKDTSRKRKMAKIYLDAEHNVEDVTNVPTNEEDGYDADIDAQVGYEVEEPPSDSEQEDRNTPNRLQSSRPVTTQASLIKDFQNLQCERPGGGSAIRPARPQEVKRASYSSTAHKRSHSEGELTGSDADSGASITGRGGSAQPQRVRRRLCGPVHNAGAEKHEPGQGFYMDTRMDVDEPGSLHMNTSTTSAT